MSKLQTAEQFVKVLNLSTSIAKKKWQHSTDLVAARKVAETLDKDKILAAIQQIVNETENEQEAIAKIKAL